MLEPVILAALILLNGVFALSELAVVSARKSRLKTLAAEGRRGAKTALALAENPGRFLSTVQIGITLIGIVAGAFSSATLGGRIAGALAGLGVPGNMAAPLGYGGIVVIVTYLSVVIGELVPKQIALRHAETVACAVAPLMRWISVIAAPAVWLLDASTQAVFRLTGQSDVAANMVTEEEIKTLVSEAAEHGVIETDEKRMIAGVLRLSDKTTRAVMTPRVDVETIRLDASASDMRRILTTTRHSRLPVTDKSGDDVIGVIHVRDALVGGLPQTRDDLKALVREIQIVPDTLGALDVLDRLREADQPMALVFDEYGHFEGIVTSANLLEAIAGVFRSDLDVAEDEEIVRRADGTWLISGALSADKMAETLDIKLPTRPDYQTVAGFFIEQIEYLPRTGETIEVQGWRFEIVDMDGNRVDKVLAQRP
ncbi:hemolysin family protein [Pelagibacterium xiamenense]|uniref:hemolysin family protein n=1 Tax=Pelagibacterium xiamenense TaxID=2901140 RepID=UPI001E52751A|nr:hemolysin family protein [Pelagibacterium xiamenense]MCD7060425.1 hemolysin family protein [Pelagibacterium xiamenense]